MKTISTPFFDEMVNAKQTYCSFCMRGSMPFLEDCEQCKISKMFQAAQKIVADEMTLEERSSVEMTRDVDDRCDLPKELLESIGKGPRTKDGFRTTPVFRVFLTGNDFPNVEVQLVEAKTGFPDFEGTKDEPSSHSTVHYITFLKKAIPSTVQIWDITYESLREELHNALERMRICGVLF